MYLYINNILNYDDYESLISWLYVNDNRFKIGKNNDRSIIKRKQIWYQKNQLPFDKKWEKFDRWRSELVYDPIIIKLENIIKKYLYDNNIDITIDINSCLINKYSSGSDFIKFHQDSNKAFGGDFYTIIISIGETRTLQFRNIKNDIDKFEIRLCNNSLFICYPDINKTHEHSIIKDNSLGTRYSFTFRKFIENT